MAKRPQSAGSNRSCAGHEVTRSEGAAPARYGRGLLPLDRMARTGLAVRDINPTTGDGAIPTLGATMRLFPKGLKTRRYRATNSEVVVVLDGTLEVAVPEEKG